jgi:hypothetical protein
MEYSIYLKKQKDIDGFNRSPKLWGFFHDGGQNQIKCKINVLPLYYRGITRWGDIICILKCGQITLDHSAILAKGVWKMPFRRLTIQLK